MRDPRVRCASRAACAFQGVSRALRVCLVRVLRRTDGARAARSSTADSGAWGATWRYSRCCKFVFWARSPCSCSSICTSPHPRSLPPPASQPGGREGGREGRGGQEREGERKSEREREREEVSVRERATSLPSSPESPVFPLPLPPLPPSHPYTPPSPPSPPPSIPRSPACEHVDRLVKSRLFEHQGRDAARVALLGGGLAHGMQELQEDVFFCDVLLREESTRTHVGA